MDTLYAVGIALCMVALLVMLIRNYKRLPWSNDDGRDDDPRRRFKS